MGGGGRLRMERIYVYLGLIHVVVWQKPTQHCKAIILQLNFLKKITQCLSLILEFREVI